MTDRTVSELREEIADRLRTVDEGMTAESLAQAMRLEGWLVDALLLRMVVDGAVITERDAHGHTMYLAREVVA